MSKANGLAYVAIPGNRPGKRIGIVKFGESGYYEARGYDYAAHSTPQVEQAVHELNARIGVPDDVAQAALFGSMWGWHVPAAAPARRFYAETEVAR